MILMRFIKYINKIIKFFYMVIKYMGNYESNFLFWDYEL